MILYFSEGADQCPVFDCLPSCTIVYANLQEGAKNHVLERIQRHWISFQSQLGPPHLIFSSLLIFTYWSCRFKFLVNFDSPQQQFTYSAGSLYWYKSKTNATNVVENSFHDVCVFEQEQEQESAIFQWPRLESIYKIVWILIRTSVSVKRVGHFSKEIDWYIYEGRDIIGLWRQTLIFWRFGPFGHKGFGNLIFKEVLPFPKGRMEPRAKLI